jgi:hypothetical protein
LWTKQLIQTERAVRAAVMDKGTCPLELFLAGNQVRESREQNEETSSPYM